MFMIVNDENRESLIRATKCGVYAFTAIYLAGALYANCQNDFAFAGKLHDQASDLSSIASGITATGSSLVVGATGAVF